MSFLADSLIGTNRQKIIELLRSTQRKGIDGVIDYLEASGFFTAPSSEFRHHNWKGGLAEHCLGVYHNAITLIGTDSIYRSLEHHQDSIIIAALLHDICKARKLYYDESGRIKRRYFHIKGHGYRSIKLLKICGLSMTEDERLAIRWHMGGHHASENDKIDAEKARESKLWNVIHIADHMDAAGKDFSI